MLIGAALPFLFSGMLIEAVAKAARKWWRRLRRQFRELPGILTGKQKPDYRTCIEISTKGALSEMRKPSLMAIVVPLGTGFLFGPWFVGGLLIGATISAIMLAVFTGNAGGAWDNAKKFIESGGIGGQAKVPPPTPRPSSATPSADPLKDTVGPSLDILIKIMSTGSLIAGVLFNKFNLLGFIQNLF